MSSPRIPTTLLLALLPLSAFVPGMGRMFGLTTLALAGTLAAFVALEWIATRRSEDGRGRHVAPSFGTIAVAGAAAMASEGPFPLAWAFMYFATALLAVRHGRSMVVLAVLSVASASISAWRFETGRAPSAISIAHALFPALAFTLLGGFEDRARAAEAELAGLRASAEAARDREARLLVARTAHDGVGGLLTAAALRGEVALRALGREPDVALASARRLADLLSAARRELHGLAERPMSWANAVESLRQIAHDASAAGLSIVYETTGTPSCALEAASWTSLRNSVREAVTNVVRHARAGQLTVRLEADGDRMRVLVADDGTGVDPAAAGFGRSSIEARAAQVGGTATWERARSGTRLHIDVPVRPSALPHLAREPFDAAFARQAAAVAAVTSACVVVLPAIPPLTTSMATSPLLRAVVMAPVIAVKLAACAAAKSRGGAGLAATVAPLVDHAALGALIVSSDKPDSMLWLALLVMLWTHAFTTSPAVPRVAAAAGPLGVFAAFWARGYSLDVLGPPLFLSVAFPLLQAALARAVLRQLGSRRERSRLTAERIRAESEVERMSLLEDVRSRLDDALAAAETAATCALEATEKGSASARSLLEGALARVRAAMAEVRAALWALDARDAPWARLEPHLRRFVAEASGAQTELVAPVPPEAPILPRERLEVLLRLRSALAQPLPPVVRVTLDGAGHLLVEAHAGTLRATHPAPPEGPPS